MKTNFKTEFLIAIIVLLFFNTLSAQDDKINSYINSAFNSKIMRHAQWSLSAKYVDDGEKIIDVNSHFALAPASTQKLVTTSAALEYLGSDFRFETKLYYKGEIADGILKGDIIIRGGGDPTLGSDLTESSYNLEDLMKLLSDKISDLGIKKITGSVIADDRLFDGVPIPDQWYWMDIGNYYGAQSSALCINDNLYYLYFKTGKKEGGASELLRVEPEIPNLNFVNKILSGKKGSGDNGYIYCAPNTFDAVLRGTLPPGKDEFSIKGAIPNPPLFAAQYLKSALAERGISVSRDAITAAEKINYQNAELFYVHKSPPLAKIVFIINKISFNLYAEQLFRMIGLKYNGQASIRSGSLAVNAFLNSLAIDTSGIKLYDGSGLSRSDYVTADLLSDLLIKLKSKKYFEVFYNSLGVAGNPTDRSRYKYWGGNTAIANNVRIKSGTIGGVKSHAGYLTDKNGRMISFCFIANNFDGSGSGITEIHKNILIKLAESGK